MGMQAEFNWYIVLKDQHINSAQEHNDLDNRELSNDHLYTFTKSDYRIYPMETPIPIIYNGKCIGIGMIKELEWSNQQTNLKVAVLLAFEKGDPTAKHYEDAFYSYREEQEAFDDGGKVNLREIVNPMERKRL